MRPAGAALTQAAAATARPGLAHNRKVRKREPGDQPAWSP